MSQRTQLIVTAALAVAITLGVMTFTDRPTHAQARAGAVCEGVDNLTALGPDKPRLVPWMNQQLAAGKTQFAQFNFGKASAVCAW
jgi:hypothetical protein